MPEVSAPPDKPQSTVERVVATLRERIRAGRMMPGQRLVEADITQDLDVSRSSVREALRRLAAEGLVEIQYQRGARVRQMTRAEVLALYDIRELLEGLAARGAADHLAGSGREGALDGLVAAMAEAERAGAISRFLELNLAFHELIVELSRNAHLPPLLKTLQTPIVQFQFRSLIDMSAMTASHRDHVAIAEAVARGDADAADAAMRRHVRRAADSLMTMPDDMFAPDTE
ncbi:MAG: GntR family transcriptional regulator [Caulobacterales bacterium]|nr:GntR family transcriptional regulator [Caulobacterales bacterium]